MMHLMWSHLDNYSVEKQGKMSSARILAEWQVQHGYRDRKRLKNEQPRTGNIYFLVIARIGRKKPRGFGKPMFPNGKPAQLVCLCLEEASEINVTGTVGPKKYRRIGVCVLWDHPDFWKSTKQNQDVVII